MDKYKKIIFVLLIVSGVIGIIAGQYMLGGVVLLCAFGVYNVVGGGDFNERNLYEKKIENCDSLTIEQLYELLKDMDTPFGKCWLSRFESLEGPSIIFGPGMFKDYIAVGKVGDTIWLKSSTVLSHIQPKEEDSWHMDAVVDTVDLDVNPNNYSCFASYKVVAAAMMDDLLVMIEEIAKGNTSLVKDSLDMFKLYHYNSSDSIVRDRDDNEYAKCSAVYDPLSVVVYSNENEELAAIRAAENGGKNVFDVTVSGEKYGTLRKNMKSVHDEYYMDSPEGDITITGFRAVRKANLSCNYRIRFGGTDKAVIAANAKLEFEEHGFVENNIVCSYDDDFLVLYIAIEDFILTQNKYVK